MAATKSNVLELLVYEEIGENWWSGGGVTAATISSAIKAAGKFDSIVLRINSPGGDCFEGVAIFNLLRSQKKPISAFVDGIAASAASVIAMAGDELSIGQGGMLMIHNAMWGAYGDAQVLRSAADVIEGISETVAQIYVERSKKDAAEVKALMDAETWMSGAQAVELGFADKELNRSGEEIAQATQLARSFNMKGFQHAPAAFRKEVRNESVDPDCTCECNPCCTIGCSGCENDPCEAEGCDCPNHQDMSAEIIPDFEFQRHRLALRERLV